MNYRVTGEFLNSIPFRVYTTIEEGDLAKSLRVCVRLKSEVSTKTWVIFIYAAILCYVYSFLLKMSLHSLSTSVKVWSLANVHQLPPPRLVYFLEMPLTCKCVFRWYRIISFVCEVLPSYCKDDLYPFTSPTWSTFFCKNSDLYPVHSTYTVYCMTIFAVVGGTLE